MSEKYNVYAFYRHRPKFIQQFDSSRGAKQFVEKFTAQEKDLNNGFEFCYIEVLPI
jgi:hypothetical protein